LRQRLVLVLRSSFSSIIASITWMWMLLVRCADELFISNNFISAHWFCPVSGGAQQASGICCSDDWCRCSRFICTVCADCRYGLCQQWLTSHCSTSLDLVQCGRFCTGHQPAARWSIFVDAGHGHRCGFLNSYLCFMVHAR